MLIAPGSTSISVDVFFADDTGAAVTGKVAADFPTCKWSGGSNTADTSISLTDLAAITTAHPNDNTAGGVKEREGGVYRLDLPNNMFTAAGRKTLTFAEAANKRIILIGGILDCQYAQVDVRQLLGTAWLTPGTAGTPDVNVKLWNALATVELPLVPTTAGRKLDVSAGGEAGVDWANVGTPGSTVALSATTIGVLTTYTGNTPQTGDAYAYLGTNVGALGVNLSAIPKTGFKLASDGLALVTTWTVAITGNITGNLSGSVGSVTGSTAQTGDAYAYVVANLGALGANLSAVPKTGFKLASDGLAQVTTWTVAITGNITGNLSGSVGSVTGLTASNLDVAVSTRLAAVGYTAPNNSGITDIKAVTDAIGFTVPGFIDVNIQYVNDTAVDGVGSVGDPWGPV